MWYNVKRSAYKSKTIMTEEEKKDEETPEEIDDSSEVAGATA